MTEKLKRCPFCGGTANIAKGQIEFWAYCPHCGVQTELYETENEVVDAWNARPIENELTGKTGKLEAENTRLQRKLNESIDDNYKNALKIQQQAERGAKFAQKENTRLREALELIAKSNFYFARGEEDKQLSRVCEIARNALNGNEK